jgi:uncharacterized protein (TIGR00266 family)
MPTFTITGENDPFLHVNLRRGEKIYTESGSMVCMDGTLELKGKMRGGFFSSLGRSLANDESLFQTTIEAKTGDGDCLLAPGLPGDIWLLDVGPQQYRLNDGAFLAAEDTVDIKSKSQRVGQALFGGAGGFFVMETSGHGKVAVSSFGTIFTLDVKPGQETIVDNTHVVAWDARLDYKISTMSTAGSGFFGNLMNSVTTGEGLVNRFSGQGQILVCSRNRDSFSSWVASKAGAR